MKLVEAMYGWNRNSDEIDVGPWPDTTGWSDRFSLTGGACYTNIRQMSQDQLAAQIFIDFHSAAWGRNQRRRSRGGPDLTSRAGISTLTIG